MSENGDILTNSFDVLFDEFAIDNNEGIIFNNQQINNINDLNNVNTLNNPNKSKLCFVCESEPIDYFFKCRNGVCLMCTNEHLKTQISKYKTKFLSSGIVFLCVGPCRCKIKENSEMEVLMNPEVKQLYYEILLLMYLNKTKDIISCPNYSCNNYGIYNPKCNSELTCNNCQTKWLEKKPEDKSIFDTFKEISMDGYLTGVRKFLTLKKCMSCQAPIEKAEGCKHIECNRCDYAFCWNCNVSWELHNEKICMGLFQKDSAFEEDERPDFIIIGLILAVFFCIMKVIFSFMILLKILYFLIKTFFFGSIFFVKDLLILNIFNLYLRSRKKLYFLLFIFNAIIEQLIIEFSLHPFPYYIYRFCNVVNIIFISAHLINLYRKSELIRNAGT